MSTFTSRDFRGLYQRFGKAYRIDPRLIEAVVRQESAGKPHAFRYEAAIRQASYGLMQVLGSTARGMGLEPAMSEAVLCDPEVGVLYGVKVLADNLNRFAASVQQDRQNGVYEVLAPPLPFPVMVALARYNGGYKGNPGPDGSIRNSKYVEGVAKHFTDVCRELT